MRLITREQFIEAAENATIRIIDGRVILGTQDVSQFSWEQPVDYVCLARAALETITCRQQILFFYENGIWSSSENQHLFRLVTKALFNEDIADPMGRYFQFFGDERDAAQTLLQIGLQSGWGGLLFGTNDNWFQFDHDGFGIIQSSVNVVEHFGSFERLKILPSKFKLSQS
jgi:hypothetical protein